MENNKFTWLTEDYNETVESKAPSTENTGATMTLKDQILARAQQYKTPLIFGFIILALSLGSSGKSEPSKKQKTAPPKLTAFVSMWPIAKGEVINFSQFKSIFINPKGLSKSQTLQLFDAETLNIKNGKLTAKKDIPPNKPIFWNDLTIKKTKPLYRHKKIKIHFGTPENLSTKDSSNSNLKI